MKSKLIAVATNKRGTLSPHAGRARMWTVFLVDGDEPPQPVWDIKLNEASCLHEWHVRPDPERHPLHSVDVAIAGSAGDGVIRRLAERGTELLITAEESPLKAVVDYLNGTLAPALPHDEQQCHDPDHREHRHQHEPA